MPGFTPNRQLLNPHFDGYKFAPLEPSAVAAHHALAHRPSQANQAAFERAVDEVAASARRLVDSLVTNAGPRYREVEAERAKMRFAARLTRTSR